MTSKTSRFPSPFWPIGDIRLGWLIALALLSLLACGRDAQEIDPGPPPNVLVILVDALRADHLGIGGYSLPTSPAIDQLAEEGVTFTSASRTPPGPSLRSPLFSPRSIQVSTASIASVFRKVTHTGRMFSTRDTTLWPRGSRRPATRPSAFSTRSISSPVSALLKGSTISKPFEVWVP